MTKRKKCWLAGFFAAVVLLGGCAPGEDLYEITHPTYEGYAPLEMQVTEPLEFPYVIRSASLIVLQMASYEGPVAGENSYEQDVAAILVSNPTGRLVEYAVIEMQQGTRTLNFEIRHLSAGGRILVTERHGQAFSEDPVQACRCTQMVEMQAQTQVSAAAEDGCIMLTNNGESTCTATVFYKSYYPENNFFIGGESRSVTVFDLRPGESRRIEVRDFSKERTRIVAIKTE